MIPVVKSVSFEEVEQEWDNILSSCKIDTVFVTSWWQKAWWQHFGSDYSLQLLSLVHQDQILGLAPLVRNEGVLGFVGDTDLFDYHDFVVPQGNEELFYTTLLKHLAQSNEKVLDLKSLPENSNTLTMLPKIAESIGLSVSLQKEDVVPALNLPNTWEDYVNGLGKKYRHELRRKFRRLNANGSHIQHVYKTKEDLSTGLSGFFRLHKASTLEKASFWNEGRQNFFTEVLTEAASRNILRLSMLDIENKAVATCISFDYGSSYLLYNSGYDPSYMRLSVGLLNTAIAIKDAIHSGRTTFDFLRGGERYKYELGAEDRYVYRLTIRF